MSKITKQVREIEMNPTTIKGLRKSYEIAVKAKALDFEYMGAEFDTRYAGYLLEFYESAFKSIKPSKTEEPETPEAEEVKKLKAKRAVKSKKSE